MAVPQLGALIARVPGVAVRAEREDALLGPAPLNEKVRANTPIS